MSDDRHPTLRQRLLQGGCLVAPGVYDAFSALIVQRLGFDALYLGGNAIGLHLGIGQPFVTLTETAAAVAQVRRVAQRPIIVDGGAGFGDAAHAALAMRALVNAGADAVHIDDQVYPKRAHYHRGKGRLADDTLVCDKLRAMAGARGRQHALLIARTDCLRVTGSVDATIARCRDYVTAGADALMVLDLGPDRAIAFRQTFPDLPLFWIVGLAEAVPTQTDLAAAGFSVAVYPFNTIGAVHEAIVAAWGSYAKNGKPGPSIRPAPTIAADALDVIDIEASLRIESATTEAAEKQRVGTKSA